MLRISWTYLQTLFTMPLCMFLQPGLPVSPVLKVYLWACNLGSPKIGALEMKITCSLNSTIPIVVMTTFRISSDFPFFFIWCLPCLHCQKPWSQYRLLGEECQMRCEDDIRHIRSKTAMLSSVTAAVGKIPGVASGGWEGMGKWS